jgi:3-hydroxy-3-methylglutaryl CoA synthase/acyl carrier protein
VPSVGIEAMNIFGGSAFLDVMQLISHRRLDSARFENLLMQQKAVALPCEDPVTFGVNAAKPIVDALPEAEKDRIELLITCTESGIDFGKSLSTYIHHYLGLSRNCRLLEIKNACYSGTAGFQMAVNFVLSQASPGAKALVVTTDISRFTVVEGGDALTEDWSFAEPSSGAGATAMLISDTPHIFQVDVGANGYYGHEVMDTCRPTADSEAGDADLSLMSYLDCCEQTLLEYQRRVADVDYQDSFQYLAFHTPFGGMVKGAHRTMMRKMTKARRDDIDQRLGLLAGDEDATAMFRSWIEKRKLAKVAELWTLGCDIDWNLLYVDEAPRRLHLPTYPFQRRKYWIPGSAVEGGRPMPSPGTSAASSERPEPRPSRPVAGIPAAAGTALQPPAAVVSASKRGFIAEKPRAIQLRELPDPGLDEAKDQSRDVSRLTSGEAPAAAPTSQRMREVAPAPDRGDRAELERQLLQSLAEVLYLEPTEVDVDQKFIDLGLDSVIAVEWIRAVNDRFGADLLTSHVYDFPSVRALAGELVGVCDRRPGPSRRPRRCRGLPTKRTSTSRVVTRRRTRPHWRLNSRRASRRHSSWRLQMSRSTASSWTLASTRSSLSSG